MGGGAASKLLLVNVLPRAVAPEPADGKLVFYALVRSWRVVLGRPSSAPTRVGLRRWRRSSTC